MGEYENLDELNYLANELNKFDKSELEHLEAAIAVNDDTNSVHDIINLTSNLEKYNFYPDVNDHDDLGRYYVNTLGEVLVPKEIESYFNYEAYGRDIDMNEDGMFIKGGYVHENGNQFVEYYNGDQANIPDECRVLPKKEEPVKQLSETNSQDISEKTQNMRRRGKSR